MLILTKENIFSYVKEKLKTETFEEPLFIQEIGDGTNSAEEDGDGYVNFVFRIKTKTKSFIIKQARPELRTNKTAYFPVSRNKIEADIWKLRASITPEFIPTLYFVDLENNVFITEDVSHLKILRFQLNHSRQFSSFPTLCANYIAASHFYTSEYYLPTTDFRNLSTHFMNIDLKPVMENGIFLDFFHTNIIDPTIGENFFSYATYMNENQDILTSRYRLRDLFMKKNETIIHADLHTSNLFVGEDSLKVIDMEFVCSGPFGYDLGSVVANLLSQFSSSCFRSYQNPEEGITFRAYLFSCIKVLYHSYIKYFFDFWKKDAKEVYQDVPNIDIYLSKTVLQEMFGFAASVNWARAAGPATYPDFEMLDGKQKESALILDLMINEYLFRNWDKITCIDTVMDEILELSNYYLKMIK